MFDWIVNLVERSGYLGIALLMFVENIFPPIPSELVMPLAGFSAGRGELIFPLIILAGTLGSTLGALFWFYVGRLVGRQRLKSLAGSYGRWMTVPASTTSPTVFKPTKNEPKSADEFCGKLAKHVSPQLSHRPDLHKGYAGRGFKATLSLSQPCRWPTPRRGW